MPLINSSKITGMIKKVTDTKLSMRERFENLTQLEKLGKAELTGSTQDFDAVFKVLDDKLTTFEANFDGFIDKMEPLVDSKAVDELLDQTNDQIRSEKMLASQRRREEGDLINRLRALKKTLASTSASHGSQVQKDTLEPLSDEQRKRMLDFSELQEAIAANTKKRAEPDRSPPHGNTTSFSADGPSQKPGITKKDIPASHTTDLTKDHTTKTKKKPTPPPVTMSALTDTKKQPQAAAPGDKSSLSNPVQPTLESSTDNRSMTEQKETPSVVMTTHPDTAMLKQDPTPGNISTLHNPVPNPVKATSESSTLPTDNRSIKEQIDQITSQLSPEEQKVLKTLSSGTNDKYTLELATLIQQREQTSANVKKVDEKLRADPSATLTDEELATKLQAIELDKVFNSKI